MKTGYGERVRAAAEGVAAKSGHRPRIGIILGSGLAGVAERFGGTRVMYSSIPGFPEPTVAGHSGVLHLSERTAVLAGRFHYYEGLPLDDIVLPVFLLKALGVETLIVTNAAGGINAVFQPGDLVLISDHLNLLGASPLIGPNDETLGQRFPDMSEAYSRRLIELALGVHGAPLHEGVYAALPGPAYETPAEIRMLKALGADMVGMSTVPEVIAASYLKLSVLGVSCITNYAAGLGNTPLDHHEVVETGKRVESRLASLLEGVVSALA